LVLQLVFFDIILVALRENLKILILLGKN